MSRKKLSDLIRNYQNGTCSEKERELLDYWYQLLDQDEKGKDEVEDKAREQFLWENISKRTQYTDSGKREILKPWWTNWSWVAAAMVLIGIGSWVWFNRLSPADGEYSFKYADAPMVEKNNQTAQKRAIVLNDGSRVVLEPGSSIRYAEPFGDRSVLLTGNAFFDITSDSLRPFKVYAGDIVTRVLGTSFFIRSGKKEHGNGSPEVMEVSVVTGKVMVEKQKNANLRQGIMLTPNQQVTYNHSNQQFIKGVVNEPVLNKPIEVIRENSWFHFADTPLEEVLSRLEEAYQLEIDVNEDVMNCPVTADLTDQPLFTKLDIICAALKTSYHQVGTQIIITGGNCN